jgi:cell division protein FtsQ
LKKINAEDGVNVTSEEILNSFNVEMETNIFKVNYKDIENSIKELPYIQSASANIKIPNEIEIKYIERVPFALVKYLESYLVMDKYGYILEITREKKFENLPIIYNIEFDSYEIGSKLEDTAKIKYDNVVYLLENASQNDFKYSISEINYESIANVKMWVVGQEIEIIYGEIDRNIIGDKLNYISEILRRVDGKYGRLDVSSSDYLANTVFTERF